jgi:hypothetical protein
MKKEITVGLIVAVIGGILVYWFTVPIYEESREKQRLIEQARQDEERQQQEAQDVAAKAAAAEAQRPRMSSPEHNINRQGGDYKDFAAQDLDACLRACETENSCKAITFTKSSRQCWMKSTVPHRSDDPSYISAVKVGG